MTAPVHDGANWEVARVTGITPAISKPLAEVREALRSEVAQAQAAALLRQRADKLEDLLASGARLEELPNDLGLAAVSGTLDRQGLTQAAEPAPVPAAPPLREALVAAAFEAHPGEAPRLRKAGDGYYAVIVDRVLPAGPRPFVEAAPKVREDWLAEARRHAQDAAATGLMLAAQKARGLDVAAKAAGLAATATPPVSRPSPAPDAPKPPVPMAVAKVMFGLKRGDITMVETPTGFDVLALIEVRKPDRKGDPVGYGALRERLGELLANDVETTYEQVLLERARPRVNQARLESLTRAPE